MLFVCVIHQVQEMLPICQSAVDKLLELVSYFRPIIQQFWEDVEDGYLLTTWARKITCQVKKWEQTFPFIAIHYGVYTSLEVKGQWGLLLTAYLLITVVQQPVTSSPPSRLKRCHMDVHGLLHQQLLSSIMVKCCGLLHAIGSGSVSPMHGLLQSTSLSSPPHRHLIIPSVLFTWWRRNIQSKCWQVIFWA